MWKLIPSWERYKQVVEDNGYITNHLVEKKKEKKRQQYNLGNVSVPINEDMS